MKYIILILFVLCCSCGFGATCGKVNVPKSTASTNVPFYIHIGDSTSIDIGIYDRSGRLVGVYKSPVVYQDSITHVFDLASYIDGINGDVFYWSVRFNSSASCNVQQITGIVSVNSNNHVTLPVGTVPSDSVPFTVYVDGYDDFTLVIYDRWGNILDSNQSPVLLLDSITYAYDFSRYQQDVYTWLVSFSDSIDFSDTTNIAGHFTLGRNGAFGFNAYQVNTGVKPIKELSEIDISTSYNNIAISGDEGIVAVYNLAGKQIHRSKITNGRNEIAVKGKGIYIVRVATEKGSVSKKVLIK